MINNRFTGEDIHDFDVLVKDSEKGIILSSIDMSELLKYSIEHNNALIYEFIIDKDIKNLKNDEFYTSVLKDYESLLNKLEYGKLRASNNIIFNSMKFLKDRSFTSILNYSLLKKELN